MRRARLLRPLDRYVFIEFVKIFVATALGFPIITQLFDLVDNVDKYLNRNLQGSAIALSYLYWIPDTMRLVLPAAVLFATVFSIGALTRHSEITAAKASGMSFHRLTLPIFIGALLASALTFVLTEVAPHGNKRRAELLQERAWMGRGERANFAFASEHGRVYKVTSLNATYGSVQALEIERKGRVNDAAYPTYLMSAESGQWDPQLQQWTLRNGAFHVLVALDRNITFRFDSVRDARFTERPEELLAVPPAPEEMNYGELGRFINALERSGGDTKKLRVDRALKLAIPVTCLIIAFFGAPLATSSQRGGAAYGVGVSLATTIVFLLLIQLTRAIGGNGLVSPEAAAWLPNVLFGIAGTLMLARVRT
ncbi:MAG TPA: LptF/LptG family permease [Gemmatimonadaceae bacterium]|nr:LptF/LptG family permease [Gemmatimonadaceae bacterium]